MRWTSFTLGAALALSGTAYGSHGSNNVMANGAVGNIFQRHASGHENHQDGLAAMPVLMGRQAAAGRCGADGGNAKCPAGQCCSQWGYCGVGAEFCNPIALCQSDFGSCLGASQSATAAPPPTSTAAPPPPPVTTTPPAPPPPAPTTTTRAPPPPPPVTTSAPRPPPATSVAPPPPVSTSPGTPSTLVPSTNGMCGNSTTCAGSGHGSCCSQYSYCGDGVEFCGTGCQSRFGLCFSGFPAAPAPAPPTTFVPSTNGRCGNSTTCAGSGHGSCCSEYSYCGDGIEFCGAGCQSKLGLCFGGIAAAPAPAPVSVPANSAPAAPATTAKPVTSAAPKPPATSATSASTPAAPAAPAASSPAAPAPVSLPAGVSTTTDGSCGNGKTCLGSTFGQCCSQFGFCGTGDQFCPAIVACQPEWGHCDPATN
ncbi:hypothetical protein SCUCBS95973_009446 [Sporothrix curviconia]|uniref:Chitin-binding type-1 domain-containing protein n=1 Tax=Sporothrix curviconia TaxID=1260050 RepID=A0ABP0CV09_9PEZI